MKTDEEIAENWYYKNFPVTLNLGEEARKREVIDIFLAGLNAGKDMAETDLATIAYMQGAEAKGKRIEELENERVELIGKVAFLENYLNNAKVQIEKMKCCGNCVYEDYRDLFPTVDEAEHIPCDNCKRLDGQIFTDVLTSDNWKLREIEE